MLFWDTEKSGTAGPSLTFSLSLSHPDFGRDDSSLVRGSLKESAIYQHIKLGNGRPVPYNIIFYPQ